MGTKSKSSVALPPANTNIQRDKVHLDPKMLFELVSKNYETWLHAMSRQLQEEENFLPFPAAEGSEDTEGLNYSLLEALEKASDDFSTKINKLDDDAMFSEIQDQIKKRALPPKQTNDTTFPLLKQSEINFLRDKITQMINQNEFNIDGSAKYHPAPPPLNGFSLYDTCDEEGLHEGNTDAYYDDADQDDYDIEEITGDDAHNTRHFEVELNGTTECEEHGFGCDCARASSLDDGPLCEFTFEYDSSGKLVPVYNNVEEKLRMMSLQDSVPPQIEDGDKKKKTKKKSKKKSESSTLPLYADRQITIGSGKCCLFCEYEAIFGTKPRQMIKWYDNKMHRDTMRREEIKNKLANAKLRAIKKQRELRQRQMEAQGHHEHNLADDHNNEPDDHNHNHEQHIHGPDCVHGHPH